jgi:hypothetical protein
MSKAISGVIIHQTCRLHMSVNHGAADKAEASFFEILRKGITFR